jgi:polyhydroxybutyrate depolymerase
VHAWSACKGGAQVELIRVQGGGHTWPGGTQYLPRLVIGAVCRDFDAVPFIFDFFAKHRRMPATPAVKRK